MCLPGNEICSMVKQIENSQIKNRILRGSNIKRMMYVFPKS